MFNLLNYTAFGFCFHYSADADEYFLLMEKTLLDKISPIATNVMKNGHSYDSDLHSKMKDFWNMFSSGKIEQNVRCLRCNNVSKS